MKNLFQRKGRIGTAGMSLIELIISAAILAIVGIAIGGAMYVSSRSYTRNSAEINVQEEAQVASNLICDWLVDADSVDPPDGSSDTLTIKHYEYVNDVLELVTVTVSKSGSDLIYTATHSDGSPISSGTLATNVTDVNFSSKFKDNRNVRISIDFEVNDRTYHSVTDSTSRNHDFIADGPGVNTAKPYIVVDLVPTRGSHDFDVFLEPGQNDSHSASYEFDVTVYNYDPSNTTFNITGTNGDPTTGVQLVEVSGSRVVENQTLKTRIKVSAGDKAINEETFTFVAQKTLGGGVSPETDTKTVTLNVRRATECNFVDASGSAVNEVGSSNLVNPSSMESGKAGAIYNPVYVNLGSHTYPKVSGAPYDNIFVDASSVKFFYVYEDGSLVPSSVYEATEVTSGTPGVQVKLKTDLDQNMYVVAVSTHWGEGIATPYPAINTKINGDFYTPGIYDNRLLRAPYSITGWDYLNDSNPNAQGVTWDVFKIASTGSSNPPFPPIDGDGYRRGTQAFRIAKEFDPDFVSGLMTTYGSRFNDMTFYTSVKFRERKYNPITHATELGPEQEYIVYATKGNEFTAKYKDLLTMRVNDSTIFNLTSAYDIEVCVYSVDTGRSEVVKKEGSRTAQVPACVPYVAEYDNSDHQWYFKADTYDSNSCYEYHTGSANNFYVFFTGFDPKNITLGFVAEVWEDKDGDNKFDDDEWSVADTTTQMKEVQTGEIIESPSNAPFNTVNVLGGINWGIHGYSEDAYPDNQVTLRKLFLGGNNNLSGNYYRLRYTTNFQQAIDGEGGCTYGSVNTTTGAVTIGNAQSATLQNRAYDVCGRDADTGTEFGYIYIHGN